MLCGHGLSVLRENLRGLYRGDIYSVYSCQKTIRPSKPGVVCWMGLTGYHAAIVCIGEGSQHVPKGVRYQTSAPEPTLHNLHFNDP